MKRILVLLLLTAGCAQSPPPQPSDFVESCTTRHAAMPAYRLHAVTRTPVPRESLESYLPFCTRTEVFLAESRAREARREFGAMAAAIILGSASNALAEHNFYVYDVPRAARYLGRN